MGMDGDGWGPTRWSGARYKQGTEYFLMGSFPSWSQKLRPGHGVGDSQRSVRTAE